VTAARRSVACADVWPYLQVAHVADPKLHVELARREIAILRSSGFPRSAADVRNPARRLWPPISEVISRART
jgi:hypothetical protein